ncbi:MAG: M6 family metalloprotease domain-containing protein [Thermotogales bacterium 46_20]|nr:MAG: M6 family metalloprotease domain-containing protein [Thermotogales bacterium 46_20]
MATKGRIIIAGEITPTGRRVGLDKPDPSLKFYKEDVIEIIEGKLSYEPSFFPGIVPVGVPTIGNLKLPVLLINYSDTQVTYAVEDFEEALFGSYPDLAPLGSMRDYYKEISYGLLDLTGNIVGWFEAENKRSYYANRASTLVREVLKQADKEIDFSVFDNNGDGEVDIVVIIHQGMGQEFSGDPDDIWSHMDYLSPAFESNNGVKIRRYTIQPERLDWCETITEGCEPSPGIATIGVISHETGHVLGLPDLYDYTMKTWGIGDWGLMGYGCWNYLERPGDSPSHMTAWSKLQLGWVQNIGISDQYGQFELESSVFSNLVFSYTNDEYSKEYFLLETRSLNGFDSALPGSGLMIYHVDDGMSSNDHGSHFPRRLLRVVQADGKEDLDNPDPDSRNRGDAGDPFPGSSYNTVFNDFTEPDANWYDGSLSNFSLVEIAYDGRFGSFGKFPDSTGPSLSATVNYSSQIERRNEYTWSIDKDANPGIVGLEYGATETIQYTVIATRTLEESKDSYVIEGSVEIENKGDAAAGEVEATLKLMKEETEVQRVTESMDALNPSENRDFAFVFAGITDGYSCFLQLEVTSSNATPLTVIEELQLETEPSTVTEIDPEATVTDFFDSIEGIDVQYLDGPFAALPSEWHLTGSEELIYNAMVTNTGVEGPAILNLVNTAELVAKDTQRAISDSTSVEVSCQALLQSNVVVLIPKIPPSGKVDVLVKILETDEIYLLDFAFSVSGALIEDIVIASTWEVQSQSVITEGKHHLQLFSNDNGPHRGMAAVFKISVRGSPGTYPAVNLFASGVADEGRLVQVLLDQRGHLADLNQDGFIDEEDLQLFRESYGKKRGDPDWDEMAVLCDLNNDDTVGSTIMDLAVFALHSSIYP